MPKASARSPATCSVDQIANEPGASGAPDPITLAAQYAAAGRESRVLRDLTPELIDALEHADDARVRVAALGALVRGANQTVRRRAWRSGAGATDRAVRLRAAELTPHLAAPAPSILVRLIADPDELVADAACFAAGEVTWPDTARARIVRALTAAAVHTDPLVRESAVAALGSIGDPAGVPAILAGCSDRPTVRRRAVLALAPFDGPEIEAALQAALTDSDWQTRQAAEDLLNAVVSESGADPA